MVWVTSSHFGGLKFRLAEWVGDPLYGEDSPACSEMGPCHGQGPCLLLLGSLYKGHVGDVRKTSGLFLALTLSSSVILGNFLHLSESHFALL